MAKDNFIKYLMEYYNKHNTINNIPRNAVVIYEGEKLAIGEFIASLRKQHKLYINGETSHGCASQTAINRYTVLDLYDFEWEPKAKKDKELEENDKALIYVINYYKKNKTLNGIEEKVIIDKEEVNIRSFITHIRDNHRKYLRGNNEHGSDSETSLRRYKALDKINFEWEPQKATEESYEQCDKYIAFLENYFKEHKSLDNLPKTITFEDEELNIENFVNDRRKNYHRHQLDEGYVPSKLELKRWQQLDTMNFVWYPKKLKAQERMENDKYIKYLEKHYKKYGTINNITSETEVIFEGELLKIGSFISDIRKRHKVYVAKQKTKTAISTPLMLKRYSELDKLEINWRPLDESIASIARKNGLKATILRKYVEKFHGNIEKAIKICSDSRKYRKRHPNNGNKQSPSLNVVAEEFNINTEQLIALINRPALKVMNRTSTLMYDKNTSLRQYCIENGLNYNVIYKAVKLRMSNLCDEDLPELINRCICEYKVSGQNKPSTWVYSKYGNELLVSHFLTYLNLDAEAILRDMSKNCIPIEKAMENNSFRRSSQGEFEYLEFIYNKAIGFYNYTTNSTDHSKDEIADLALDNLKSLQEEYQLTKRECNVWETSVNRYINAIEQYRLFDVAFEKDEEKRIEKIISHKLDEDDIEEAFFLPLKFDQNILLGRNSELYNRRMLLKNMIVSWNYISKEKQQENISKFSLNREELSYINQTRKEIDTIKEKVFTK